MIFTRLRYTEMTIFAGLPIRSRVPTNAGDCNNTEGKRALIITRIKSSIVPVHAVMGFTLKRKGVCWKETETNVFDSNERVK